MNFLTCWSFIFLFSSKWKFVEMAFKYVDCWAFEVLYGGFNKLHNYFVYFESFSTMVRLS